MDFKGCVVVSISDTGFSGDIKAVARICINSKKIKINRKIYDIARFISRSIDKTKDVIIRNKKMNLYASYLDLSYIMMKIDIVSSKNDLDLTLNIYGRDDHVNTIEPIITSVNYKIIEMIEKSIIMGFIEEINGNDTHLTYTDHITNIKKFFDKLDCSSYHIYSIRKKQKEEDKIIQDSIVTIT